MNNLADKEYEKYDRMQVRFNRTLWFLDYLAKEEKRDFDVFNLQRASAPICDPFMPIIISTFREDREYIENRLREGILEDTPDEADELSEKEFQGAIPGLGIDEGNT